MEKRKIRLLIVDDEEAFLRSLKKLLEVREFAVTAVDRGEKALEEARRDPPEIALVDLKMPGMNGQQTLEALKKEHPWMEIVILTGHGSVESAIECTRSGAYFYLQKPCELDTLVQILTEAYKRHVMRKKNIEKERMEKLLRMAQASTPREILRRIRELDADPES